MSRVYNVMTGGPRPAGTTNAEITDEGAWASAEETPYVEIGGPSGTVFSPNSNGSRSTAEVRIDARPDAARAFPRLVTPPTPAYLSVRYHDLFPRTVVQPHTEHPDPSLVALHHPDHSISGEYRALRDQIRKQLPDATSRVLMFNAVANEAGTTTVMLNLAITLAPEAKVLVVDANVARATIAAKLAVKPAPGLCEALSQEVPLSWVVQPTTVKGLHVIAAGDPGESTNTSFSDDFSLLLMQLRKWFDWILIDCGVWGGIPDRDGACPAADAVYLVSREADTNRPEFLSVRGWVKELGGLLRGYVTTRT